MKLRNAETTFGCCAGAFMLLQTYVAGSGNSFLCIISFGYNIRGALSAEGMLMAATGYTTEFLLDQPSLRPVQVLSGEPSSIVSNTHILALVHQNS